MLKVLKGKLLGCKNILFLECPNKGISNLRKKCISFWPKMYIIFAKNVAKKFVKGNTL